ncbi:MAG: hypothetical protein Q9160_006374 [Pyrenula sp. 1 TL-2023]
MPRRTSRAPKQVFTRVPKANLKNRQKLDALAIAGQQVTERPGIRRSRLGELEDSSDDGRTGYRAQRANKRRRIEGHDEDNDIEQGSDSDGNTWQLGAVDSGADSDLDSNEAMNESDEERFADFVFGGSKSGGDCRGQSKRNRRRNAADQPDTDTNLTSINLSENIDDLAGPWSKGIKEAEDEQDSLGEEAVDLATALDMNEAEEQLKENVQKSQYEKDQTSSISEHSRGSQTSSASGSGVDSEEEEGGDTDEISNNDTDNADDGKESTFSFSDDDAEDIGNHIKLQNFVESLKKDESPDSSRARANFKNLPDEPSPFGVRPSQKLTVADILPTITDSRLRQSLKVLHNNKDDEGSSYRKGVPGKLAPPLAKRQQDQLDRSAAYEKSKETLNRWIDTVKHNRRADHLSFPLSSPNALARLGSKELLPTSQSQPITSLEHAIQNIMKDSGLGSVNGKTEEDQIQALEQLEERKMPIDEVHARRAELRRQRDLMFREEKRARRIKKIKSKAYRRVHRKVRDKEAQLERQAMAEAGLLNSEDEREQNDRRRAEERMGARHRESKWAKAAKASGKTNWDVEAKSGITDIARRDEELRRKIEGRSMRHHDTASAESSSSSDRDDSEFDSDDEGTQRLKRSLAAIDEANDPIPPNSNLASMKFMQRAEAGRKATNDADMVQLREHLTEDLKEQRSDIDDTATKGRQRFGPRNDIAQPTKAQRTQANEFEAPLSENDSDGSLVSGEEDRVESLTKPVSTRPKTPLKRKGIVINPKASQTASRDLDTFYSPWLADTSKSRKIANDDILQINIEGHAGSNSRIQPTPPATTSGRPKSKNLQPSTSSHTEMTTQWSESESENGNDVLSAPEPYMTQEQLVRAGFAGDDVENDFAKEKEELVQEEGDQVIDNTLPGWGSWTGEGTSKREQKRAKGRFVTTVKGVDPQKRKDAKLDRVLINEKKVKKVSKQNGKYLASELPFPYASRQQYERAIRMSLGPEWNTKNTFQDATKPRVLIKQGIIRPMERPMV